EKVRLNPRVPSANLPTRFGTFRIYGFESQPDNEQAVALVKGKPGLGRVPLVRIHSQCFTGDTLHSLRCDCGEQMEKALEKISESEFGILLYQMQEWRGIGLINKLHAYELQDKGVDTVEANLQLGFEADQRKYHCRPVILNYLKAEKVRQMSKNPHKVKALEEAGIEVVERVPLVDKGSRLSARYLRTKKEKMGHLL